MFKRALVIAGLGATAIVAPAAAEARTYTSVSVGYGSPDYGGGYGSPYYGG